MFMIAELTCDFEVRVDMQLDVWRERLRDFLIGGERKRK